jgi:hypothetical protein
MYMPSDVIAAWIVAGVSIVSTAITVIWGVVTRHQDDKRNRQQEILMMRKDALLKALEIIDNVYANTTFNNKPPSQPYDWQIADARTALNRMMIYCANPEKTVGLFYKAIGLYDPKTQKPPGYSFKDLVEFRKAVAEELNFPEPKLKDTDIVWINTLHGGK